MSNAHWISDGSEVPCVPLKSAAPRRVWRLGAFEFAQAPRRGRWSCQTAGEPGTADGGRVIAGTFPACGAAGYRTPFGAFLAVLRVLRQG